MKDFDVSASLPAGAANGSRALRIPRWLVGISVIAALTFAVGFYLPAQRANQVRATQIDQLSREYQSATQSFAATSKELAKVQKERDELSGKLAEIQQAKSSANTALDQAYAGFETELRARIDKKQVSLEKGTTNIKIILEGMYLIYPGKTEVHRPGAKMLCEIVKAIPKKVAHPTQIIARANGEKPWSKILENQFESSWQLSAGLAAEVAKEMEKCGVPGTELRAVGAAHFDGDPGSAKKSPARFEIFVFPKQG
jgi:flagellar motor protein MotB